MVNYWEWAEHKLLITIQIGGNMWSVLAEDCTQEDVMAWFDEKFPVGDYMLRAIHSVMNLNDESFDLLKDRFRRQGNNYILVDGHEEE